MSKGTKAGNRGRKAPGASEKLEAIITWAKQDLPILPLAPKGKKPIIPGGVHSATLNKKALRKYFGTHPEANYGVATGAVAGAFVVDVDGEEGRAALLRLEKKHGPLQKTVTVQTARGHHYYFASGGVTVRN